MKILVTGAAGFIGYHLVERLLALGREVTGADSLNAYYDPGLKRARLARLQGRAGFEFRQIDLADRAACRALFAARQFDVVVHLAAQAGVRWSIDHPEEYVDANLVAFGNMLEGCRRGKTGHLVFASSSSVYGANNRTPYAEGDPVDHPVSLYAATKRANELMAHSYAHLFGLPATGLRFFTVYGPWGRPDMAYYSFTRRILAGETIPVFNRGDMRRDFTWIDDIVEGVVRILERPPQARAGHAAVSPAESAAPFRLYNIGNHSPVNLLQFIALLGRLLGREPRLELLPMQAGDVYETCAEVADLAAAVGFAPATPLEDGLARFVAWYREYHRAA